MQIMLAFLYNMKLVWDLFYDIREQYDWNLYHAFQINHTFQHIGIYSLVIITWQWEHLKCCKMKYKIMIHILPFFLYYCQCYGFSFFFIPFRTFHISTDERFHFSKALYIFIVIFYDPRHKRSICDLSSILRWPLMH